MTREINGRIRMVVSDDGTRCAAECPRWSETPPDGWRAYHSGEWCAEYGALHGARSPACIAAEQAAASVPSCEGIADDIERLERHIHKNGDRLGDDIVESIERIISVVVTSPPVDAPHFDGGARALDASEALREARVQGMREGFRIVELRADQPGEHGYESDPGVAWEDASMDLDAAIEAVRKGER